MPLGDLVQCDFCDEALNLSFCNQCSVRLCVQCKEKHESLVDCKEEVVAYSSRLYPNVKWCKFHKNEEESIALCKTCTVPLCSTCLEMHEDHDLHFKQLKDSQICCSRQCHAEKQPGPGVESPRERSARRSTYKDPTFQSLNKCKENFTVVQQKEMYPNCSQICCSRQCLAGKQAGVKSPRGGSARRSTYKDPTFESLNKCKEKPNSIYDALKYAGSGEEFEARSHEQQTDREERLTSATCFGKLNYWLHVLKQSVEKLNELYNNERIHPPQPPKEQKHQQTRTKFQTKKSSRPMSAVSEEIIHLRKNVEILEKVTQLSSYEDPAQDHHLFERLKAFKSELILEDQIIDDLKIMQNIEKQLTETWNKKVESLLTENEQLKHELRIYGNQTDALQRRNQELVSEITRKNEEIAEYNTEKQRLEQKAHQPFHQQFEIGKKENEPEIQRLQNIIDKLLTLEKMLRYEVDILKKESRRAQNGKKDCEAEIKKLETLCGAQREEINLKTEELHQLNAEIKKMKSGKQATITVEVRKKKQSEAIINAKKDEKMRGEIASLKDKRSAMENENERLKKQLEIVHKQLLEKERELKRCINDKESVERKMIEKIEDQMRKNTELELELSNLQKHQLEMEITLKENQSVKTETEEIEYDLQSKEKYIRELSNERKRLKTEMGIMKEEINNGEKSKQMLSYHQRLQIENTQKELSITKDKLNSWQKKYKQIDEEKRDADNRRSELEKAFTTLEEENMVLKDQIARLREETAYTRKDTEKINIALEMEKEDQIRNLQHQISKLNKSEQYLKLMVTKHQEDYDIVKKVQIRDNNMLLEKEKEISILKQELCRLQEENDFRNKIEQKQVLHNESVSFQTELKLAKAKLHEDADKMKFVLEEKLIYEQQRYLRAEKEGKEKEEEIRDLQMQLKRMESEYKKLERNKEEMDTATKRDTAVKEHKLRSVEDELKRTKSELTRLLSELEKLKRERLEAQSHKQETILEASKEKSKAERHQMMLQSTLISKDKELENLTKQLESSKETILTMTKDMKNMEENLRRDTAKLRGENGTLQDEVMSLKSKLSEANELIKKIKQEENKWKEICSKQSNMLKEKEKDIVEAQRRLSSLEEYKMGYETMRTEKEKALKRYLELSRDVENKERDFENLKHQLSVNLQRAEDLTKECHDLRRDNQNMEIKILRMTKAIQEKEKELESQAEQLASSEEKVASMSNEITRIQQTKQHDAEESARRLLKENNALKLDLEKVNSETQQKISVLNNEIKGLRRSQGHDSEEKIKKLSRENISLNSELERITASLNQLRKDYAEVKREKDHALNRLSSVAGEKLRDNNPGIADLSDENRPINLGEKFSQLYDDQWTDAMENLEENLGVGETEGIQCLLSILKRVFDECVRISDDQFTQLKEITGTTNLPSDQLKKLKDLRKSTALQSVKNVKQLVNKAMSCVFSKEKDACQSYIDRCTELCWLMCVQDPPVVIDFTAVRGQVVDDKMLRKFTKTGSKIDFLVWPMIRLHKNGPLLQKGVVQPL